MVQAFSKANLVYHTVINEWPIFADIIGLKFIFKHWGHGDASLKTKTLFILCMTVLCMFDI